MKRILRVIIRFSVLWFFDAVALLALHEFVSGITLTSVEGVGIWVVAVSVALVLAILNTLVRPVLILLTAPINIFTLGFFALFVNAGMLILASYILPYFQVNGLGAALLGAFIMAVVNTLLTSLIRIDDDYSFFYGVIQWLSKKRRADLSTEPGRGLVMVEIDGLSYHRIQRAVEQGLMPTVRQMVLAGTHRISGYDCGLPSQTSSCQAGIMYGENYDIPAFRWYDKDGGKLIVSSDFHDAAMMNARYSHGQGLLRGGSSINNHMAGDAKQVLFTMSVLTDRPEHTQHRRLSDLNLVFVNPYMFARIIILTLWDVLVELGQALRQKVRNVQPRISRLHKGYPLVRAATNVFLRDLGTFMIIMDIMRGVPATYTTFVGYDEVAHHAGPDTKDAMNTLKGLDKQLNRILDVIRRKAPRPYDVILLSDHGQSAGATFKQRYGQTLTELIQGSLKEETTVADMNATESGYDHSLKLLAEIRGMEENVPMNRARKATFGRARKVLQRRLERTLPPAVMDSEVIVCDSGNLANVYFNHHAGKVSINELNAAYPNLLDSLVAHPGVGFIVAYAEDDMPVVLGQDGARNLSTGAVTGDDPLLPYGAPNLRAEQLLRLAQFPHAGDLIVNSTLYEDGQVAAFEELVGSHGGLGGQQTEAFLLHPADMIVPQTSNATDIFALMDARRGIAGEPLRPRVVPKVNAWALRNLVAGMRQARIWGSRLVRALRIQRAVFREVADDSRATGQALITLLATLAITASVNAVVWPGEWTMLQKFGLSFVGGFVLWMLIALLAHLAGRLLRGKGDFTRTMRTLAFARVPYALIVLEFVPVAGPVLGFIVFLAALYAMWVALQEALELRPRVALLIPIVGAVLFIASVVLIELIVRGTALTIVTLLL
jgi:uncharacterized membrane protein YvlD (DUF360 family)